MKLNTIIIIGLITLTTACDNDSMNTVLLTSKTWGKPEIIHNPNGYYTSTNCKETYKFSANGDYLRTNECTTMTIHGHWMWSKLGKEIRLETVHNNIPQKTYILTVVELTKEVFHTKEREDDEPVGTNNYWELKYRHKTN